MTYAHFVSDRPLIRRAIRKSELIFCEKMLNITAAISCCIKIMCPHCSKIITGTKQSQIWPHPPYNSSLASYDLFLFPIMRKDMKGCQFESKELIGVVQGILKHISKDRLGKVYEKWQARMHRLVALHGE